MLPCMCYNTYNRFLGLSDVVLHLLQYYKRFLGLSDVVLHLLQHLQKEIPGHV
ncbi:hypothetical protein DPMN_010255 [Dreissena polymorpha]|uniref:Uncharacterized protein n=1 Tax=Dreissena polymorpha TaxID=45954 RepID=A0A9D4N1S8_DREPO|nr:hypothetical protein DPMN_010255 [Dreissena polymorpha]